MSCDLHCENCPLKKRPAVGPIMNEGCDLLIVGEGPGEEEVRLGKPFMGPSGKLLFRCLKEAGFDDSIVVSVVNATQCRPNAKDKVTDHMVGACRDRLLADVERANPKVILALGNTALHGLLGSPQKITKMHGIPIDNKGRTLVPCIHPAAVLRGASNKQGFQSALNLTVALLKGSKVAGPGETKYIRAKEATLDRLLDYLCSLPKGRELGCDIETTGFNPRVDTIVALGISWEPNKVLIIPGRLLDNPRLKAFLESEQFTFIWHNGKFDISFLRHRGIQARVDRDCMLLHYTLNEQRGTHDLGQLATDYLMAPVYKGEVDVYKKKGWRGCPENLLSHYLAQDCDYTLQLHRELMKELEAQEDWVELQHLYQFLLQVSELLFHVEQSGFWANREHLNSLEQQLMPEIEAARENIQIAVAQAWERMPRLQNIWPSGPPTINPASSAQVCKLLYSGFDLKPPRGYSLNAREETRRVLQAGSLPDEARAVLEAMDIFQEKNKVMSTYVRGIRDRIDPVTGRIHSSFQIHGTTTGRLASKNPNTQNVPRVAKIRGIYQAPEGRLLLETDLDQAELRVLANLSGDAGFISIYREGRKLHHEVAKEMYGTENFTQDQYIRAKAVNFGIAYGRTASSLAKEYGGPDTPADRRLTLKEAERLVQQWFERFPDAFAFIQRCRDTAASGGTLRNKTGRRRRFDMVNKENIHAAQNEASNFPIQSTASDITLMTAIRVRPLAEKLGAKIVNLVHDSIVFEVPNDEEIVRTIAETAAEAFRVCGHELLGDDSHVPFTAEFKLGREWGSLDKVKWG